MNKVISDVQCENPFNPFEVPPSAEPSVCDEFFVGYDETPVKEVQDGGVKYKPPFSMEDKSTSNVNEYLESELDLNNSKASSP